MNVRWLVEFSATVMAAIALLLVAAPATDALAEPPAVSFDKQIRPLLSDRCYFCHGPDEDHREAGLRLDVREAAIEDLGGGAAIVPGDPDASLLLQRVTEADEDLLMPPLHSQRGRLSEDEVGLLRRWIEQGAEYEPHWAFAPLDQTVPPEVAQQDWVSNPIDAFVLAPLEAAGLAPSPLADRATLIRRVYLDLTGLLPSPAEVARFAADRRPDAYLRLVESLLASPHFAERWGRHWLDQARYADSNGYSVDSQRAMWPYRDWVIAAIADDLPFREFTIQQLAGDLLPEATKQQRIASAFHRNTLINQEGGSDPEQFRHEAAIDRVNTTGAVWLGLTLGCAQCHTHKYDPITHREYYELFAFFNSGTDVNNTGATVSVARGEALGVPGASPAKQQSGSKEQARSKQQARLMVMAERPEPRPTYISLRGDFLRPDEEVGPLQPGGLAAVAPPLPAAAGRTRLELANWLVDDENPLTPRVTVNRVWMRYFGRGLVETEDDFGMQGTPPTHPELLDWLARYFLSHDTSMKSLHRLIVTSSTYRQASAHRQELQTIDPRNLRLARQNRIRVEAEIVRDAALAASGELDRTLGGPSVHPPQPAGVHAFTQRQKNWTADTGGDRFRRAMYTEFFRSAPHPLFTTFDAPDFQVVCTRRGRSNTPLQALTVANDEVFIELARAMAQRVMRERAEADVAGQIEYAFQLGVSRPLGATERAVLQDFYNSLSEAFADSPAEVAALLGPQGAAEDAAIDVAPSPSPAQAAALVAVCRAILNTDNFITRE